jgi:hypothetical protein
VNGDPGRELELILRFEVAGGGEQEGVHRG